MRFILVLFFLSLPIFAISEVNLELHKMLLFMELEDQKIRKEINTFGAEKAPQELLDKANVIDAKNTRTLKNMIKKYGWPNKELIGIDGVSAMFLIIQHSSDLNFQESMLPNLERGYQNNEGVSGQQLALLTDRVLLAQGKKQIYGTQVKVENNEIIFKPIESEETVDNLRKKMKMPPLAFYKKLMEEAYGLKDHPDIELN